jgi:hypothetical protein
MTPTARSLDLLRRNGYVVDVVERWIPGANIRRDLFHFGDLLAVHPTQREIVIVQCTTLSNLPARVAKIKRIPELSGLLAAGVRVQVHGWARRGGRWQVQAVDIRPGDAEPVVMCRVPRRRGGRQWQPAPLFDVHGAW